ncbi:MAG: hypothetical protein HYT39_04075 [Candidatus Sungbacteria bacterium]|nr:hypothetical protein [Candidatus Sungbacteria bacterium]
METPSAEARQLIGFTVLTAVVLTVVIGTLQVLAINGWIGPGTAGNVSMACFIAGLGAVGLKYFRCR